MRAKTKRERELEAAFERELDEHLAEMDADRAVARRFFWKWLLSATAMTLLGNAGHALLPPEMPKLVRLAVALTPPLVALIAIHGVTVLARVGAGHRDKDNAKWTFRAAVAATVLLALDAAAISFNGLYTLALDSGQPKFLAILFPLAIDAGIALATLAIYHLRPASTADLRAAREAAKERRERELAELAARQVPESMPDLDGHKGGHTVTDAPAEDDERARAHADENVNGTRKPQVSRRSQPVTDPATVPVHDRAPEPMNGNVPAFERALPESATEFERSLPDYNTVTEHGHERSVPEHNGHDPFTTEACDILKRTGKRTSAETVAVVLRKLDEPNSKVSTIAAALGMGERTVREIRDARRPHLVSAAV